MVWPGVLVADALTARWPVDAHAQLLHDTAPPAPDPDLDAPAPHWYRYSSELVATPRAEHVELVAAAADLDRPEHAPWPTRAAAAVAVATLAAAYPDAAVWATRAGVRLLWVLARPVPVRHARWYLRHLHAARSAELPAALGLTWDYSAAEWQRVFRLPRVTRDGVALELPSARLDAPPSCTWWPDGEPEDETRPAPPTLPVPPVGPVPTDVPPPPTDWVVWLLPGSYAGRAAATLAAGAPWGDHAPQGTRNPALKQAINSLAYQLRKGGPAPTPIELFSIFAASVAAEQARDPHADGLDTLWRLCNATASAEVVRRPAPVPPPTTDPDAGPPLFVTHGPGIGYVLRGDGTYAGPLRGSEIYVHLREHHPGAIPLTKPNQRSLRPIDELIHGAATAADDVELYYPAPGDDPPPAWIPARRTVRVRTVPLPLAPAEESPAVADWLDALLSTASSHVAARVLDWLATAARLDRPTAALYMQGGDGLGKGLLAEGLAAMWGRPPLSFREVVQKHNDGLLRAPVVLLDEGITADKAVTSAFRSLVGQSTHRIEPKGKPVVTLHGCPRVIVAANNASALDLRGGQEAGDLDAIGARILHVEVAEAAGTFLRAYGGRAATAEWVVRRDGTPGDVPRHLAWLAATRAVAPGGRFLVEGVPTVYHLRLLTSDPLYAGALVAIALALAPPSAMPPGGPGVFVRPGEDVVWVNPVGLHGRWQVLVREDVPRPTVQLVAKALAALARTPTPTLWDVGRESAAYWPIGSDLVLRAAADLGVGDPHRVRSAFVSGTVGAPDVGVVISISGGGR